MASSTRLRLFSPIRVWLTFNALMLIYLLTSGFSLSKVSRQETQKLIDSQRTTLIKARADDLDRGDYRSFVEGIGKEFQNLFVSIHDFSGKNPHNNFAIGQKISSQICSSGKYSPTSGNPPLMIELCRPYSSPWQAIGFSIAICLFLSAVSLKLVSFLERDTLNALVEFIQSSGVEVKSSNGLTGILSKIKEIKSELDLARKKELEQAKIAAKAEVSLRVAHDIRAPIEYLEAILEQINFPDESARASVLIATDQLKDLANDVLNDARGSTAFKETAAQPTAKIIADVIQEKKLKFKPRKDLKFDFSFEGDGQCITAFPPKELKRILSNLIENSAEAISGAGTIAVNLNARRDNVEITVADTGRGIPNEVLPRLMARGFSHGKENGNGLGLYHAKSSIESHGGTFSIESEIKKGTTAIICLPRLPKIEPCHEKNESTETKVSVNSPKAYDGVLIDNDDLVHKMWKIKAKRYKKNVLLLKSDNEFEGRSIDPLTPFYVDKDLGDGLSGLDVLKRLHQRGYQSLYLYTADPNGFQDLPSFVKEQRGKTFPFSQSDNHSKISGWRFSESMTPDRTFSQ